jgi:hypothetical protein
VKGVENGSDNPDESGQGVLYGMSGND